MSSIIKSNTTHSQMTFGKIPPELSRKLEELVDSPTFEALNIRVKSDMALFSTPPGITRRQPPIVRMGDILSLTGLRPIGSSDDWGKFLFLPIRVLRFDVLKSDKRDYNLKLGNGSLYGFEGAKVFAYTTLTPESLQKLNQLDAKG